MTTNTRDKSIMSKIKAVTKIPNVLFVFTQWFCGQIVEGIIVLSKLR